MFTVNEYKIVFKRRWHLRTSDYGNGRYDTVCEIYYTSDKCKVSSKSNQIVYRKEPSFTGIAKLHPNDQPDKIIGKKIALRNAIGFVKFKNEIYYRFLTANQQAAFSQKEVRTAIWKAFWDWVANWSLKRYFKHVKNID